MTIESITLPRLALGTAHTNGDIEPMVLAMAGALKRAGLDLQVFSSQARFDTCPTIPLIAGDNSRHLDSWLMGPDLTRQLFWHNSQQAELALVHGSFATHQGGCLSELATWLDLFQLTVLDARRIEECNLAPLLTGRHGVLLDMVKDAEQFYRIRTTIESVYGIPVFGFLPASRTDVLARETDPCKAIHWLTEQLCRTLVLGPLLDRAGGAGPLVDASDWDELNPWRTEVAGVTGEAIASGRRSARRPVRIAMAFDEAFDAYFPDTLDLLEASGAELVVFSPLRSEDLPPDVDVVYLGCGRLEDYAVELSANRCLHMALHRHVSRGGRIYGECAGLAYLSRQVHLRSGSVPMAGIIPAVAKQTAEQTCSPQERVLLHDSWLAPASTTLRGYLNTTWELTGVASDWRLAVGNAGDLDLVGQGEVVASRMHLHFAAVPQLFANFFQARVLS